MSSVVCPEAKSFAQEAHDQLPISPSHPEAARLSSLSESVVQQASELIGLLEVGELALIEKLYCKLSCAVSELRHLRSIDTTCATDAESSVERSNSGQERLPRELVLQSLEYAGLSFSVFPQLSPATHSLSVSTPENLGVLTLREIEFFKLAQQPKPRCVGCVEVSVDSRRLSEFLQVHSSWKGAVNLVSINCEDTKLSSAFLFDALQALQARHHKFEFKRFEFEHICESLPANFESCEITFEFIDSTTFLRALNPSFLVGVTELTISDFSPVDTDLRFLPSLRKLTVITGVSGEWKSLQCHPLEELSLIEVQEDLSLLQHPISAKRVHVSSTGFAKTLVLARMFPDAVWFSVDWVEDENVRCDLDLDGMSQLRHLEVDIPCRLVATQPIHLSSLSIRQTDEVSENITASFLACDRVAVALQMLPRLRHVIFYDHNAMIPQSAAPEDSFLVFPRTVTVELVSLPCLDLAASFHMVLNRYHPVRCGQSLQRVQEHAFSWLARKYDEGLLLRLLRETRDVSKFTWIRSTFLLSLDEQCQAIRVMLQSGLPIDWIRIVNSRKNSLELLLTDRPELATCAFGEHQTTLLHAICRSPSLLRGSSSDDDAALRLCRVLLRFGADPSARDSQGRTPLDAFPRLNELIEQSSH